MIWSYLENGESPLLGTPPVKKRYTTLQGTCSFLLGTKVAATRNNVSATRNMSHRYKEHESPLLGTRVAARRNKSRRYKEQKSLLQGTKIAAKMKMKWVFHSMWLPKA